MISAIFATFIGLALSISCTTNSNCNAGYICNTTLNQCVISSSSYSCSADNDCITAYSRCYYCSSSTGKCAKNTSCCTTNPDCSTNYYCSTTSYTCEYNTSTTCYSNSTCPNGYYCDINFNVCQKYCTTSAQCMLGYYCSKVSYVCAINYSYPLPCNSKVSCAEGYACEDSICKYVKVDTLMSKEGITAILVLLPLLTAGSLTFALIVLIRYFKNRVYNKQKPIQSQNNPTNIYPKADPVIANPPSSNINVPMMQYSDNPNIQPNQNESSKKITNEQTINEIQNNPTKLNSTEALNTQNSKVNLSLINPIIQAPNVNVDNHTQLPIGNQNAPAQPQYPPDNLYKNGIYQSPFQIPVGTPLPNK